MSVYHCSDFYLACYLRAKHNLLIKDIKQEGSRKIFIFGLNGNDLGIQEMIKGFYNGDDSVSANLFVKEIKDLKSMMFNY